MMSRVPVLSARYGLTLGAVLVHESLLGGYEVVFPLYHSLSLHCVAELSEPVPTLALPTARLRLRRREEGFVLVAPTGTPLVRIPGFEPL